jgi:uncharacterized oligopeptide transporter (OPT) family protein
MASRPEIQTTSPENARGGVQTDAICAPVTPPRTLLPEITTRSVVLGLIVNVLFSMIATYLALKLGQGIETAVPISIFAVGASGLMLRLGLRRSTLSENINILAIGGTSGMVAAGTAFTMPAIYLLGLQDKLHLGSRMVFLHIFLIPFFGAILGMVLLALLRRYFVKDTPGKAPSAEATTTGEILISAQTGRAHAFVLLYSSTVAAICALCAGALHLWTETFTTGKLSVFWVEKAVSGDKAGQWVSRTVESLAVPGTPGDWWYTLTIKFKALIALGTGAEFLGLGFIIGLRHASVILAGSLLSFLVIVPLLSQLDLGALQLIDPVISSTEPGAIFNHIPKNIGVGCIFAGGILLVLRMLTVVAAAWKQALGGVLRKRVAPLELDDAERDIRRPVLALLGVTVTAAMAAYFYFFVFRGMPDAAWFTIASVVLVLALCFVFITASAWATAAASVSPISGMTLAAIVVIPAVLLATGLNRGPRGQLALLLVTGVVAAALSTASTAASQFRLAHRAAASPRNMQWSWLLACGLASAVVAATIMLAARSAGFGPEVSTSALAAPQANLTKIALESATGSGDVPWPIYGVGAVLALLLQLAGVSPLAFGLGMFLPMSLTLPLLIGAGIGAAVKWGGRDEATRKARHYRGAVIASGFIAGAALMGVVNLGLRGFAKTENLLNRFDVPGALIRSGHDPERVGQLLNWLGLVVFLMLALFMLVTARWRPRNADAR